MTCSGSDAYLTVLDSGATTITALGPEKVAIVAASDPGDGLSRTLGEWRRVLSSVKPDLVALLLPENTRQTYKPHSEWSPRCEAETLVLLAAGLVGIPTEKITRAAVRSCLGLGPLDQAARDEPKQGKYWAQRAQGLFVARTAMSQAEKHGWPVPLAAGATREDR